MHHQKPLKIPKKYLDTFYDGTRYPGSKKYEGLNKGTNCQGFVYEVLNHFGYQVPDFRSSELWADTTYTKQAKRLKPLDITFFNGAKESYGAHLGLYLGANKVIHLCKEVGRVTIWDIEEFRKRKRYQVFLGIKRPRFKINKPALDRF